MRAKYESMFNKYISMGVSEGDFWEVANEGNDLEAAVQLMETFGYTDEAFNILWKSTPSRKREFIQQYYIDEDVDSLDYLLYEVDYATFTNFIWYTAGLNVENYIMQIGGII